MPHEERSDYKSRFKKGQSGNPSGRPKGRKNKRAMVHDVLFKPVRVKAGNTFRTVPKMMAALEVCMNSALKGDHKAFARIMDIAHKHGIFDPANDPDNRIKAIRIIVVDPKPLPEELLPPPEYRTSVSR